MDLCISYLYSVKRCVIFAVKEDIRCIFDSADESNIFSMLSLASAVRSTCCSFVLQIISSTGMVDPMVVDVCADEDGEDSNTISPTLCPNFLFISFRVSETTFSVSAARAIVLMLNECADFESVVVTGRVGGGLAGTLFVAAFPQKVVNSLFPVV